MKSGSKSFAIGQLLQRLENLPATSRYWVGFSGGADSTALLLALKELEPELPAEFRAVHFNHNLQAAAGEWQSHCQSFCELRNIKLHIQQLEVKIPDGKSPEEEARRLRYAAAEKLLDAGDIFLTAHHADDNAETFFLNLMRGSGLEGLAGIPQLRKMGKGWVARPLLEFRRKDLESFLNQRGILWLEDPSNLNHSFDRNFLRNSLFPAIDNRWPGVVQRLNQTARHARDFTSVMTELLAVQHGSLIQDKLSLPLKPFLCLDPELQAMLLRQWLREQDIASPPRQRLREFLLQLNMSAAVDKHPELRWAGQSIKRHGNSIWLHELNGPELCPSRPWSSGVRVNLSPAFGYIHLSGNSMKIPEGWEVGPRRKGSQMMLHAGGPRRKLKDLMRECGLPPWLRKAVPVLYWHDEAAAIGDWLLSSRLQEQLLDSGATYVWQPNHPLLSKLQSVSVQHLARVESSHGKQKRPKT